MDAYSEKIVWAKRKHQSGVGALDVHPDGGLVFVGEKSGFGVLWDLRCPRVIADFYNDNEKVINGRFWFFVRFSGSVNLQDTSPMILR